MVDSEYRQFQEYIWQQLPLRKLLAGKERVFDCISVVVQEWPDEQFALATGDQKLEATAVRDLMKSSKRHLHLAYGDREFGFIWATILSALLYELIVITIEWWRKRKENRMAILSWQDHWRSK
jgi:hypothetical protein